MKRPETIEETAEQVTAAGGRGVPVRCDFTVVSDVDALRDRVGSEVDGQSTSTSFTGSPLWTMRSWWRATVSIPS